MKDVFAFCLSEDEGGGNNGDNNDEREYLVLLARKPYIIAKEMSVNIGSSIRKVSRIIEELHEIGRIFRCVLRERLLENGKVS